MKCSRSLFGMQILARRVDEGLHLLRFALVGPEVEISLGDVELRIREIARSVVLVVAAEVVDMGMGHHHGIDILGIDPRSLQARLQPSGRRPKQVQVAEPGVEQDQLVASIHNQSVLLEDGVVGRQEILGQLLVGLLWRESDVVLVGIAKRQSAVSRDGGLEIADLEAVESGSLGAEHRCFGKGRVQGTESAERPHSGRAFEQMTA